MADDDKQHFLLITEYFTTNLAKKMKKSLVQWQEKDLWSLAR